MTKTAGSVISKLGDTVGRVANLAGKKIPGRLADGGKKEGEMMKKKKMGAKKSSYGCGWS